jgi:hypothetical protein
MGLEEFADDYLLTTRRCLEEEDLLLCHTAVSSSARHAVSRRASLHRVGRATVHLSLAAPRAPAQSCAFWPSSRGQPSLTRARPIPAPPACSLYVG